ncbi:MAG: NUDIX domain-containing protein [Alphaproteobacteria bacterium]|nr:MAG: NUDIX domain-containing protein [Alphaproteobacteria bacterium]
MTTSPPVRPRDAASLVPLRQNKGTLEVLMGRRPPRSVFIPDAFVFPGGKLDAHDFAVSPSRELRPEVAQVTSATRRCTPGRARALANAAIRETFEETGLMLARSGNPGRGLDKAWEPFAQQSLAPDHSALVLLGRAITPPVSPMRFHARFFAVLDAAWTGCLTPNPELLEIDWRPLDEARKLPMIDVTEWMLSRVQEIVDKDSPNGLTAQGSAPLLSYRHNKLTLKYA